LHDFIRPKANDAPTFAFHHCGPTSIGVNLVGMMLAVDFDDELPRHASEVGEVGADLVLPSKFCAAQATIPEKLPAAAPSPTAVATQLPRSLDIAFA
jgi:hypothetical protein